MPGSFIKSTDMNRLKPTSRIIIAIAALGLAATYFLPVWAIYLLAPQYPEGLSMQIWLTHLSGQVDIINGLNHYIGMAKINEAMFPEFGFLVYIVGFYITAGLLVALAGKRKWLTAYLVLLALGAVAALVDFYQWGYQYGHNLDPSAPIQVPGLYYQPPLIGHKKLLNFDAYSYPDSGGWVVIIAGLLVCSVWILEWRRNRVKSAVSAGIIHKRKLVPALFLSFVVMASCKPELQPFEVGLDQCHDCSMTIMEPHFGAALVTKKGKIYKFDDAHCLAAFIRKGTVTAEQTAQTLFVSYHHAETFIDAGQAYFVVSPQLRSPMNSHAAAFASEEAAAAIARQHNGTIYRWNELLKIL